MEKRFILKKYLDKAMKSWRLMLCFCLSFLMILLGTLFLPNILFGKAIAADFNPDVFVKFDPQLLPSNLNQKQQTSQQETTDNRLYTQLSEQELEQIFNQSGILYRKRDTEEKITYYIADFGKNRALVTLSCTGKENLCDVISVYKPFDVTNKPDLRKINQWNLSKGFGTAIMDEKGNPAIKSRYSLYGGVSLKSVRFFFLLSGYVLDEFAKYIETP
jgi:Putative bacterial sensory transduction regulator